MTEETVVAVYDAAERASEAVRELEAAGIPSNAITQHAGGGSAYGSTTSTTTTPHREKGFWASLFGAEPEYEHDTTVYDRSLEAGSTIVTVRASEQHLSQITAILDRHNPIDIDERAATYNVAQATPAPTTGTANTLETDRTASSTEATAARPGTAVRGDGETIPLSEETLSVGKRVINRGTTRIRRYVVETPVQEQVTLRDETVSVERRPVSGATPAANPDFTEKVIEATETAEEAVVSKAARVKEEVVIHKEAGERTETVGDTVRREDVEITKDGTTEEARRDVTDTQSARDPKV